MARPGQIGISFSGDSSEYTLTLSNETGDSWEYTYGNPGVGDGVGVYVSYDPAYGWVADVIEYRDSDFYPPDSELFFDHSLGLGAEWWENPWTGTTEVTNYSTSESSIGGTATISWETAPSKPINPTPTDGASDITLDDAATTWEDGGGATSYDVYCGTLSGFLSLLESGVTDLSYTLRSTNWPLYGKVYYWRIDAVNDVGTTTGDEWYFTTLIYKPPTPSGITWSDPGNDTGYTGTPTGVNNLITVRRLVAAANDAIYYET